MKYIVLLLAFLIQAFVMRDCLKESNDYGLGCAFYIGVSLLILVVWMFLFFVLDIHIPIEIKFINK